MNPDCHKSNRREFIAMGVSAGISSAFSTSAIAEASVSSQFGTHDAVGLAELVRAGHVKPTELLDEAIARTQAVNGDLNAIVTEMFDEARASIERGLPDGPFRGVPFLLKDTSAMYAGVRYTAGSRLLKDFIAPGDTELVRRYKKAGLVIFGRTNTPEFGLNFTTEPQLFGPTKNPWNTSRSPGGSSGGSAAAVASRIVPIAQGGDGGGSIRVPASCCGVFGMKPSRGRMPMGPNTGEAWEGLVTLHTLSISVRDSAAMLDATAGPDVGAPYGVAAPRGTFLSSVQHPPKKRLRIAWTTEPASQFVHADCVAAVEDAVRLCRKLGHEVVPAHPAVHYEQAKQAFLMVVRVHIAAALDSLSEQLGEKVTAEKVERATWDGAQIGWQVPAARFAKNKGVINLATRAMGNFFEEFDLLLTPTLAAPPVRLGELDTMNLPYEEHIERMFNFSPFTWIHNLCGTPAMSVPLYWSQGLPIGVQFAARLGDESTLFSLAGQLERARPWADKRPKVAAK